MSDRLTLGTGTGEPVHVKLAEGQDRASLEEDLMEAARNGTVVTVSGSVKGTSSDTIHINPSNALWWALVVKLRIDTRLDRFHVVFREQQKIRRDTVAILVAE